MIEFDQYIQYVTSDFVVHPVKLIQQDLVNKLTLDTLKVAYTKAVQVKIPATELTELKVTYALDMKLTAVYPVDIIDVLLAKIAIKPIVVPIAK